MSLRHSGTICMGRNCTDTQASGWFPLTGWDKYDIRFQFMKNFITWSSCLWPTAQEVTGQVVSGYCCDRGAGRPAMCRPLGWSRWCGTPGLRPSLHPGLQRGCSLLQAPRCTLRQSAGCSHDPLGHTAWGRLWSSCLKQPMPLDRPQMWHVTASDREGWGWGWREEATCKIHPQNLLSTSPGGWHLWAHLSCDLTLENRVGSSTGTSLWGPLGQSVGFINSLTHTFQVRPAAAMSCPPGLSLRCTYTDQQVLDALLPSRHPAARVTALHRQLTCYFLQLSLCLGWMLSLLIFSLSSFLR